MGGTPLATTGVRIEHLSGPAALLHALTELRRRGMTPRGLLFAALDPRGEVYLGVPEDAERVTTIKVGEKLGLVWPLDGRYFHFDSVHRLGGDRILFNGDRRLTHPGDAIEIAELISDFLKGFAARNVFFGCTPHQPGSWIVEDGDAHPLHESGWVETVPVAQGLLARQFVDSRLHFLPGASIAEARVPGRWTPVYTSSLGNILMLERRVIADRLVLTCEQGLIEVDVGALPDVRERARVPLDVGFGVVGRVEGAAFAVTRGEPKPWGLDEIKPALLVGAAGNSLVDLGRTLAKRS